MNMSMNYETRFDAFSARGFGVCAWCVVSRGRLFRYIALKRSNTDSNRRTWSKSIQILIRYIHQFNVCWPLIASMIVPKCTTHIIADPYKPTKRSSFNSILIALIQIHRQSSDIFLVCNTFASERRWYHGINLGCHLAWIFDWLENLCDCKANGIYLVSVSINTGFISPAVYFVWSTQW